MITATTTKEYKYSYLLGKSYKIDKSDKYADYENFIMYLAPYDLSGVNVCPKASAGCAAACLNTSGHGRFSNTQNARLQRTLHYLNDRVGFLAKLRREIELKAKRFPLLAVRLNGTSDLNWRPFIRQMNKTLPQIQYYDYTKVLSTARASLKMDNYHVTFSRSETNWNDCIKALDMGINVAVVFSGKTLPNKYKGYKVIDGDITDTRFLDSKGVIVGLTAKGDAKHDESGFVVYQGTKNVIYKRSRGRFP